MEGSSGEVGGGLTKLRTRPLGVSRENLKTREFFCDDSWKRWNFFREGEKGKATIREGGRGNFRFLPEQ